MERVLTRASHLPRMTRQAEIRGFIIQPETIEVVFETLRDGGDKRVRVWRPLVRYNC
jgi:hypothetical protein